MRRPIRLVAVAAVVPMAATACGGGGGDSGDAQIDYWLWDANQLPAYQECADAFQEQNPDIEIAIEQMGWDDYWDTVTTNFISGTAPDVFTNHLAYFPEFVSREQIMPLDDQIAEDGVDTDVYFEGLTDLWSNPEGQLYGLPKDWDTIAVFYNTELAEEAGLSEEDMWELEWNPDDGGTYEEAIAALSVDSDGNHGDSGDFDGDSTETFGLGLEDYLGGGYGQTQWSHYAASNGWRHTDADTWGEEYFYSDAELVDTIAWWRGLIEDGYMPPAEEAIGGTGMPDPFAAGTYAMVTDGSWMMGNYFGGDVETAVAPLPVGPTGERASMFNGLSDAIWSGTDHPDEAWEWVKFLGSTDCQDIVAEHAVVFPAIPSSLEIAEERFAEDGIDVSAFTVHVDEGTTFTYPITDNASEVSAIMDPTMDEIMTFGAEPDEAFDRANDEVNALFE